VKRSDYLNTFEFLDKLAENLKVKLANPPKLWSHLPARWTHTHTHTHTHTDISTAAGVDAGAGREGGREECVPGYSRRSTVDMTFPHPGLWWSRVPRLGGRGAEVSDQCRPSSSSSPSSVVGSHIRDGENTRHGHSTDLVYPNCPRSSGVSECVCVRRHRVCSAKKVFIKSVGL